MVQKLTPSPAAPGLSRKTGRCASRLFAGVILVSTLVEMASAAPQVTKPVVPAKAPATAADSVKLEDFLTKVAVQPYSSRSARTYSILPGEDMTQSVDKATADKAIKAETIEKALAILEKAYGLVFQEVPVTGKPADAVSAPRTWIYFLRSGTPAKDVVRVYQYPHESISWTVQSSDAAVSDLLAQIYRLAKPASPLPDSPGSGAASRLTNVNLKESPEDLVNAVEFKAVETSDFSAQVVATAKAVVADLVPGASVRVVALPSWKHGLLFSGLSTSDVNKKLAEGRIDLYISQLPGLWSDQSQLLSTNTSSDFANLQRRVEAAVNTGANPGRFDIRITPLTPPPAAAAAAAPAAAALTTTTTVTVPAAAPAATTPAATPAAAPTPAAAYEVDISEASPGTTPLYQSEIDRAIAAIKQITNPALVVINDIPPHPAFARVYKLHFLRDSLPDVAGGTSSSTADITSSGADAAATTMAKQLQTIYSGTGTTTGTTSVPATATTVPGPIITAQENALMTVGDPAQVRHIQQMVALYLDVPSPQVRADILTIQINSTDVRSRDNALSKANEIRAGIQIVHDLVTASIAAINHYIATRTKGAIRKTLETRVSSDGTVYWTGDHSRCATLRDEFLKVGFDPNPERPLSLVEMIVFLRLAKPSMLQQDFVDNGYIANLLAGSLDILTKRLESEARSPDRKNYNRGDDLVRYRKSEKENQLDNLRKLVEKIKGRLADPDSEKTRASALKAWLDTVPKDPLNTRRLAAWFTGRPSGLVSKQTIKLLSEMQGNEPSLLQHIKDWVYSGMEDEQAADPKTGSAVALKAAPAVDQRAAPAAAPKTVPAADVPAALAPEELEKRVKGEISRWVKEGVGGTGVIDDRSHFVLNRFIGDFGGDTRHADINALSHFLNAWYGCVEQFEGSKTALPADSEDALPGRLAATSAATDADLKTGMDALSADLQDLFFQPLLDWIREDVQGGSEAGSGIDVVGATRLLVRDRILAESTGTAQAYTKFTPIPQLTMKNLTDAQTLTPSGTSPLTVLGNLSPAAAIGLTALMQAQPDPVYRSIAPGTSIALRPFVVPGGGAARVQINLVSTVSNDSTSATTAAQGGPLDSITKQSVVTEADISAFDLVEIASFGAQTTAPGDYKWTVPILDQIPLVGNIFHGARGRETHRQESIALLNLTILPRSLDLVPFYSPPERQSLAHYHSLPAPPREADDSRRPVAVPQ